MKLKKSISIILSSVFIISSTILFSFAFDSVDKLTVYKMSSNPYSTALYDKNGNKAPESKNIKSFALSLDLPAKYDSREKGFVTSIKDQGKTGACWAFASTSAMESDAIIKGFTTVDNTDFSESHLVWFTYSSDKDSSSPLYDEYFVASDPYKIGGNWSRATATFAKWSGPADEKDYPFSGSTDDFSGMKDYDESGRYVHPEGIVIDSVETMTDRSDIKQWIIDHGSATVGFYLSNSNFDLEHNSYYSTYSNQSQNHMVTVIGWDDDFSAENFESEAPGNGAWLIKDSWGTYTHENGCFWLSYYENSVSEIVGYSVRSDKDLKNNYCYSSTGMTAAFESKNGASVANFFNTKEYEILDSVSFYTVGAQTTAKLEIYTGISSTSSNPATGTLVYSDSFYEKNGGFHTVKLDKPVYLTPGTRFAVCVTYSNPGNLNKIPTECLNTTSQGVKYTYKRGQSACFIPDITNNTWRDSEDVTLGNFPIHAYTRCNHQWKIEIIPATCTDSGKSTVMCSQCREIQSEEILLPNGHSLTDWALIDSGTLGRHCVNCEYSETKIHNHEYSAVVTKPDCINKGYTTYTCSCGSTYTDNYTNELGHSFTNYIYNNDARINIDGTETSKCDRCDATSTRIKEGSALVNPTSNSAINIASDISVDYRTNVIISATAVNVPADYHLALYIEGKKYAEGDNHKVSYKIDEMKSNINYTVRIIDNYDNIQINDREEPLQKSSEINVNSGFFKRLAAFFKGLFHKLPTIEILP